MGQGALLNETGISLHTHRLEFRQVLSVETLVFVLENFDDVDGVFEKIVCHFGFQVSGKNVKELVNAVFFRHVDDVSLTALEIMDHLLAYVHI